MKECAHGFYFLVLSSEYLAVLIICNLDMGSVCNDSSATKWQNDPWNFFFDWKRAKMKVIEHRVNYSCNAFFFQNA